MDLIKIINYEAKRKNLTEKTSEIYLNCILKFLRWTNKKAILVDKEDVKDFMMYLLYLEKPESTLRTYVRALRFYLDVLENNNYRLENTHSSAMVDDTTRGTRVGFKY